MLTDALKEEILAQNLRDIDEILALYHQDIRSLELLIELLRNNRLLISIDQEALACIASYWDAMTPPTLLYINDEPLEDTLHHDYLFFLRRIAQQWHRIFTLEQRETAVNQDLLRLYQLKRFSKPIISREAFTQLLDRVLPPSLSILEKRIRWFHEGNSSKKPWIPREEV